MGARIPPGKGTLSGDIVNLPAVDVLSMLSIICSGCFLAAFTTVTW